MAYQAITQLAMAALLFTSAANWHAHAKEPLNTQRTADFDSFCRFVEEEYAYRDTKMTDWHGSCAHYRRHAAGASSDAEFIAVLESALGEIYDHHAHLGTNTATSPRLVPTQAQLFAAWVDGRVVLTDVRNGSNAERVGLLPGMEVLEVNEEKVVASVRRMLPQHLKQDDPAARQWALQLALAGHRNDDTTRLLTRAGDTVRAFAFSASTPNHDSVLTHQVIGGVAHVRIHNSLGEPALIAAFDKALTELRGARALVLDLRDTPSGGTSTVARGIMGPLIRGLRPYQRHELVSEFRQTGVRRVWDEYVAGRGEPFLQPVVVLVGRWTGSMGEGVAIGLHATRAAPIVGQPMARLVGALGETMLENSHIVVRIPTEKLFHVDGTPREAFRPSPLATAPDAGQDPELEAAINLAGTLGAADDGPAGKGAAVIQHGRKPPTGK